MSKKVKIKELFSIESDFLSQWFDGYEYPWELLPEIGNFVKKMIDEGIPGYSLYAKGVLVGEGVTVAPTATILPPAIIGSGTEIRPGAYIRGNVIIGENCVIGNSTELKNCILLNKVQVPHYNYVGDSVLGKGAHLGAGAVCSNLKADKKPVLNVDLWKELAALLEKHTVGFTWIRGHDGHPYNERCDRVAVEESKKQV